jgi:hypothetical protein
MMADDVYPSRVRFYDRQFLQAGDLTDEQFYHLRMRWRHNLALHSWGILTGLEVTFLDAGAGSVTVAPGMALDGYGRELVLAQIATNLEKRDPNADYDVLLYYGSQNTSPAASGKTGTRCPSPQPPSQQVEKPTLHVVRTTDRASSVPDKPGEVRPDDLDFRADELPPEDPARLWPVLLGRLVLQDKVWVVDTTVRRYAGLIAERIEPPIPQTPPNTATPPVQTVILTGSDPNYPAYRFAVVGVGGNDRPKDATANPPLLGVKQTGDGKQQIEFRAERVSVAADMMLRNGSVLEFQPNPVGAETEHNGPLSGRQLWRMYHHFEPPKSDTATGTTPSDPTTAASPGFSDEIRITMPGTATGTNQVSIGTFSDKGVFTPILSVQDNGTVAVFGNLTVKGRFTGLQADAPDGQVAATGGLSDTQVLNSLAGFLANTSNSSRFEVAFKVFVQATGGPDALAGLVPQALDVGHIQDLAAAMWGQPDQATALGKAVGGSATVAAGGTTPAVPGARAGTFKNFLRAPLPDKLHADSVADPDPDTVEVIGDWIFEVDSKTQATRSGPLAMAVPSDANDQAIVAFAKGLQLEPTRRDALLAAVTKQAGAAPVLTQLVSVAGADPVGDLFITTDHLTPATLERIGKRAPDAQTHPGGKLDKGVVTTLRAELDKLSAGLSAIDPTNGGGRPWVVIAGLVDEPTAGFKMLARALDEGIKSKVSVADLSALRITRLGKFISFLQGSSEEEYSNLLQATIILAMNPPGP